MILNKIYHGDCLEIMPQIADKSIDMILTDPPYKLTPGGCVNPAINGHFKDRTKQATKEAKAGTIFKNNNIKFKDWMTLAYKVLKDTGHFYCMSNAKNLQSLLNAGTESGFVIQTVLVWAKGMHTPSQYYLPNIEFVVLFRKGHAKYINNMGTKSLIELQGIRGKVHPSEKPPSLMQIMIENSSNKNDIILDPFAGSGTTGIACKNSNRQFILMEKELKYYEIAKKRIENMPDRLF